MSSGADVELSCCDPLPAAQSLINWQPHGPLQPFSGWLLPVAEQGAGPQGWSFLPNVGLLYWIPLVQAPVGWVETFQISIAACPDLLLPSSFCGCSPPINPWYSWVHLSTCFPQNPTCDPLPWGKNCSLLPVSFSRYFFYSLKYVYHLQICYYSVFTQMELHCLCDSFYNLKNFSTCPGTVDIVCLGVPL